MNEVSEYDWSIVEDNGDRAFIDVQVNSQSKIEEALRGSGLEVWSLGIMGSCGNLVTLEVADSATDKQ